MTRICFFFLLGSLLMAIPQPSSFGVNQDQGPWLSEIERLAKLSEEEIDIGNVSLLLAKEAYPDLEVKKYSDQIDHMVEDIRKLTKGSTDPDYRIRAMNTYLYEQQGFHYDKEDPYGKKDKNRYLNGILDTKSGSCQTMPLLYLALAQRLGYPVYPVAAPQHLFLRYESQNLEMQNIEATEGGGYSPNDDYILKMDIPQKGIKSGAYLETMTYKQLLGDLITENGTYWARQGDAYRAAKYLEIGTRLNSKAAEAFRILGNLYFKISSDYRSWSTGLFKTGNPRNDKTIEFTRDLYEQYCQSYMHKGDLAMSRARFLGVAPPLEKNYWLLEEERALKAKKL